MPQQELRDKVRLMIFENRLKQYRVALDIKIHNTEFSRWLRGQVNLKDTDIDNIKSWIDAFKKGVTNA